MNPPTRLLLQRACTVAFTLAIAIGLGELSVPRKQPNVIRSAPAKFWAERAYPFGYIPSLAREKAVAWWLRERTGSPGEMTTRLAGGRAADTAPQWQSVGPSSIAPEFSIIAPVTGHVEAVALDPRNSNVIYAGAASGGVWKTTDGGTSWQPLTDNQAAMDISALAIDPGSADTLYAATGYYYQSPGLLKTTDGGATWRSLPLPQVIAQSGRSAPISAIAVSPADSRVLLLAFGYSGNGASFLFGDAGLYRSADGGQTWQSVLRANGAHNVVFDPTVPSRAYAALGMAPAGSIGNGIYQSLDAGATWSAINGSGRQSLPIIGSTFRKFQLALAPSQPTTLYAAVTEGQQLVGLFKTNDSGRSWTPLPTAPAYCTACIWTDTLVVDPVNPDVIFAAGQDLWRSLDGGNSWSVLSRPSATSTLLHADHHLLKFSADGSILLSANDGGVFLTANPAATNPTWKSLNSNLAVVEFYQGLSVHPSDLNTTFAGTQDNSSIRLASGQWTVGSSFWGQCGDGFNTALDFQNPSTVYFACLGTNPVFKSVDGGKTIQPASSGIGTDLPAISRVLTIDSTNASRLYFGGRRIFQSIDAAANWRPISPDLTGGHGQITAIAVAPSDPNVVYAGATTSDIGGGGSEIMVFQPGSLWITANALQSSASSWQLANAGLPNRWISRIAVDPRDSSTAYVAFSGFNAAKPGGHVFKTVTRGQAWSDISSTLPDVPINDLVLEPSEPAAIYVASDIGVFKTSDGGSTWRQFGVGLPRAAVTGLVLHRASCTLRASTWGRGMWDASVGNCVPAPRISAVTPLYSTAATVQPASWISIYGSNLATTTATWNGDFPTSLGGVTVSINDQPAYLWFVSPTQINAQAPDDATRGPVTVTVSSDAGTATATVRLADTSPSFSLLSDGKHAAGVIVTPDGSGAFGGGTYDLLGPSGGFPFSTRPVRPGESLILYGVGFGPTSPAVAAGKPVAGAAPVSSQLVITIGGVRADVAFAGITAAGTYQFNLMVPNVPSGENSLAATVGGVQTGVGAIVTVK